MITPNSFTAQVIPSGGADTDMFVGGTIPVAMTSQNMAITNWSSAPITNWPATPSSFQMREALASLSRRCPHVNEDMLIIALEEHNFVVDDATDLLLGIGMDDAMSAFLVKVFPQVPHSIIDDQLSNCYRRYLETFTSLVKEFHPYWNPHPHALPSAMSLSPPTVYRPDFTSDRSIEMDKESDWWSTLASTIRWQVSAPSPDNNTWTTVMRACMLSPRSFSPRLADLACRLIGPESKDAFSTLMILLAYTTLVDLASNDAYCNKTNPTYTFFLTITILSSLYRSFCIPYYLPLLSHDTSSCQYRSYSCDTKLYYQCFYSHSMTYSLLPYSLHSHSMTYSLLLFPLHDLLVTSLFITFPLHDTLLPNIPTPRLTLHFSIHYILTP